MSAAEKKELRIFIGGWIGATIVSNIPWWDSAGLFLAGAVCVATPPVTWWYARRALDPTPSEDQKRDAP